MNMDLKENIDLKSNEKIQLLQLLRDNIEFSKKQQWTITNYTLLLNGAVIGLYNLLLEKPNSISCLEKGIISGFSSLILALSLTCLWKLYNSIKAENNNVLKIHNNFPELKEYISNTDREPTGHAFITIILTIVMVFGLSAVFWFIYK